MRTLLIATFVALSSLAAAQTPPPLIDTVSSQQDAAKKAWVGHAIEHILGGTDEHTGHGGAGRPALN